MAQSVKIILEDDLDGGHADETIQFSLDGRQYEIDLSEANATRLRESLNPFVAKARRQQNRPARTTGTKSSATKAPASSNGEMAKIRAWAKDNGHTVSDRGRIPQEIQKAYAAAQ